MPPGYPAPEESKKAILNAASLLQGEVIETAPVVQMKSDIKNSKKKKTEKAKKEHSDKKSMNLFIFFFIIVSVVVLVILTAMRLLYK